VILEQARSLLKTVFDPVPIDTFFDEYLGRRVLEVPSVPDNARWDVFGADPVKTLLDAYATHGNQLAAHSDAPKGPVPKMAPVDSQVGFQALIKKFHEQGYTVRIPDVSILSIKLKRIIRSIEFMIHKPVKASLFWSAQGARAPIHYDDNDNIVIQLIGTKEWYVSNTRPSLHNPWRDIAEMPASLGNHRTICLSPGSLLYVPRGVSHTVYSKDESMHLALTFTPVTLREAVIAALDHLSDFERPLREGVIDRIDAFADPLEMSQRVCGAITRLHEASLSPEFLANALQRRASRVIGNMERLAKSEPTILSAFSLVRHTPLAMCHMLETPTMIDFCQPGEHINVHRGVEPALRFIAATPSFYISDLPGGLSLEIQTALVNRLIVSGFLEVHDGPVE
jgi:hypothetical protein